MSLKDFFSKKQNKNKGKRASKIGGAKSDDLLASSLGDMFGEDDFKKKENPDVDLTTLNKTQLHKDHISLKTEIEDNSTEFTSSFTNKYEGIDDFESKLNELSAKTQKGKQKPLDIKKPSKNSEIKKNDFDLGTSELDAELKKSEIKVDPKQKIIDDEFSAFNNHVDETTLMNLYKEEEAKNKISNEENNSGKKNKITDDTDLLKSEIKEVDLLFNAGALANEIDAEGAQEKLEIVEPDFKRKDDEESYNEYITHETQKTEDIFARDKTVENQMTLEGLGTLDAALDIHTVSQDSISGFTVASDSPEKKEQRVQRKRYSSSKKEQYKKSIFGNMSVKSQYMMFCTTLFVGAIGLGSSMFFSYDSNNKEVKASKITSLIGGESQQFHSSFRESLIGVNGSYRKMLDTWDSVISLNKELRNSVVSLQNPKVAVVFNRITESIEEISKNVQYVKSLESILKDASARKEALDIKLTALANLTDRMGLIYTQVGANQVEMAQITQLKNYIKNVNSSVSSILVGEAVGQASVDELNSTKELIQTYSLELLNGSQTKGISKMPGVAVPLYSKFSADWKYVSNDLDDILRNADSLAKAKSITKSNSESLDKLSLDVKILSEMYNGNAHGFSLIFKNILIISVLLLVISLAGLGYVYRFESEKKERELKSEADRNKKSVNKLLNEMVYLQTGNLTKKTTVEEGITLDIADSVNATIDSLVVVVSKIKNSSFVMKQKTNEINLVSTKLLDSTERQSDSIVEANESINNIAKAIHQISEKTKESLITAQNSAEASNTGARQVKESIESMNAISKNMEETVLLMKKVSDSSKQISEVIGLLSDITEETNILALNATVQAAKAGEAGRGFKVVADSIQELADNAAEATRRVGALIATVQTDIQSVGSSIEKTNQEVERGVELSENAGQSLNEITEISNKLAGIVKSISRDANTNAEAARQISNSMSAILKITEETKDSTKKTTNSIAEIDKMSSELSESVKTFIVP